MPLRKRRNSDDNIRKLERKAFETEDQQDILAYWQACLRAGVDPKPNANTVYEKEAAIPIVYYPTTWSLAPNTQNALPEIYEMPLIGEVATLWLPGKGWQYQPSLQAAIQKAISALTAFVPPSTTNVLYKGGFAAETKPGQTLLRPGRILKNTTGTLVRFEINQQYQVIKNVTKAFYKVKGYRYPVVTWWSETGERIA